MEASDSFKKLEERIVEEIHSAPRSYAEVAYDEFWIAALTLKDIIALQQDDIGSLKEAFINTANSYVGVTGRTELNDAGDRKSGSYDFWAVRPVYKDVKNKVSFEWTNVAAYQIGIDNS
ncbi:MAG TPA: hypothetical protein VFZ67_12455 [Nitrososphaera sp.]